MTGAGRGPGARGQILFEFTQIGQQMRVAAIDADSGTEVILIAPVTATRIQMQALAQAKLRRRLQQLKDEEGPGRLF
ncbi:serine hydroxymethyltransferase [Arsenicitalea aurantiaca]|uniref:Serine hydroxymethyltransferase n=1 Tax=Arsenicitalea aurantiaca TaxID=1783274 RepID=A0A433XF17_9HYPH|nr:serine hydroxymethyltransferase [Arsenicitalea aurantiaca]RUT32538.1 serine hydroxymethyltransferase [Arsenicitalea aurantiaca]